MIGAFLFLVICGMIYSGWCEWLDHQECQRQFEEMKRKLEKLEEDN